MSIQIGHMAGSATFSPALQICEELYSTFVKEKKKTGGINKNFPNAYITQGF